MSTYSCKLDLNDVEIKVVAMALDTYIREYDQKNLLQPWNKTFKDVARGVRKRMQHNAVASTPEAVPEIVVARRNSRPQLSAHMRHKHKKR